MTRKKTSANAAAATARPAEPAAEWVPLARVYPWAKNPRKNDQAVDAVAASIEQFGFGSPLVARRDTGEVIAGHTRLKAAIKLGLDFVPVRYLDLTEEQAHKLALADNKLGELAEWDSLGLAELLRELPAGEAQLLGWTPDELNKLLEAAAAPPEQEPGSLSDDYGAPPFTVFDTRSGRWQERRQQWLALGIQSEVGRGSNLLKFSKRAEIQRAGKAIDPNGEVETGTSIFDPVLCELLYAWLSPPNGLVLDPFAGGSVRGIIAAALGRRYRGVELRADQVAANREQWNSIGQKKALEGATPPEWIQGDALAQLGKMRRESADFFLACPPYMDLEVYSDDPNDISNMDAEDFAVAYRRIIAEGVACLKPDRFACFVVSEVREKNGIGAYRRLPGLTVDAFEAAGARYYNEGILVNSAGSLPIRCRKQFEGSRKLGRTHQNILMFVKGNPKKAALACGKITRVDWSGGEEAQASGVTEWRGDEALAGEA